MTADTTATTQNVSTDTFTTFLNGAVPSLRRTNQDGEARYCIALVDLCRCFGDKITVVRTQYTHDGVAVVLYDVKCKGRGGSEDKIVQRMYQQWCRLRGEDIEPGLCPFRRGMCIGAIGERHFLAIGNFKFFYASTEYLCQTATAPLLRTQEMEDGTPPLVPVERVLLTEKANGEYTMCTAVQDANDRTWLVVGSKNVRLAIPYSNDTKVICQSFERIVGQRFGDISTDGNDGKPFTPSMRFSYLKEMFLIWVAKLNQTTEEAHPKLWKLLRHCTFVGEQVGVHKHIFDDYSEPDIRVFAVLNKRNLTTCMGCDVGGIVALLKGTPFNAVKCERFYLAPKKSEKQNAKAVQAGLVDALRVRLNEIAAGPIGVYGEGTVACTYDAKGRLIDMFKFKNQEYAFDRRLRTLLSNVVGRLFVTKRVKNLAPSHAKKIRSDLDFKREITAITRGMEKAFQSDQFSLISPDFAFDRVKLIPFVMLYCQTYPNIIGNFSDNFTSILDVAKFIQTSSYGKSEDQQVAGTDAKQVAETRAEPTTPPIQCSPYVPAKARQSAKSVVTYPDHATCNNMNARVLELARVNDPLDDVVRAFIGTQAPLLDATTANLRSVDELAQDIAATVASRCPGKYRLVGMSAPPGCGKSTLFIAVVDLLQRQYNVNAAVFDRDTYVTLKPRDVSDRWYSDISSFVAQGKRDPKHPTVAFVGNCLDGTYTEEIEKVIGEKMLLIVPEEVAFKLKGSGGKNRRKKKKTNPMAAVNNPSTLRTALFMCHCMRRLLGRETMLVLEADETGGDVDMLDDSIVTKRRWKLPTAGSTLTMELGAGVVFNKYFTTGPTQSMVERRQDTGDVVRVRMLDVRTDDELRSHLDKGDQDLLGGLVKRLLEIKERVLTAALEETREPPQQAGDKPLSAVTSGQLPGLAIVYSAITPVPGTCVRDMHAQASTPGLEKSDGHVTVQFAPTDEQVLQLMARFNDESDKVVRMDLVQRVVVKWRRPQPNPNEDNEWSESMSKRSKKKKKQQAKSNDVVLEFLAPDLKNDHIRELGERLNNPFLHVTLGTTNRNILPPSVSRMVLEAIVDRRETEFELSVKTSRNAKQTVDVAVVVQDLPKSVAFAGVLTLRCR